MGETNIVSEERVNWRLHLRGMSVPLQTLPFPYLKLQESCADHSGKQTVDWRMLHKGTLG